VSHDEEVKTIEITGLWFLVITRIPDKSSLERRIQWMVEGMRIGTKTFRILPSYFSNFLGNIKRDWYNYILPELNVVKIPLDDDGRRTMILVAPENVKDVKKAFDEHIVKKLRILAENIRQFIEGQEVDLSHIKSKWRREKAKKKIEEWRKKYLDFIEELRRNGVENAEEVIKDRAYKIADELPYRAQIFFIPIDFGGEKREIPEEAKHYIESGLKFLERKVRESVVEKVMSFMKKFMKYSQKLSRALASKNWERVEELATEFRAFAIGFRRTLATLPLTRRSKRELMARIDELINDLDELRERKTEAFESDLSAKISSIVELL